MSFYRYGISAQDMPLLCHETGADLTFVDKKRGTRWLLDPRSQIVSQQASLETQQLFQPVSSRIEDCRMIVTYQVGNAYIDFQYILHEKYVEVHCPVTDSSDVRRLSLPGSFTPDGETFHLLLPIIQGMLRDGRGPASENLLSEASHNDSMRYRSIASSSTFIPKPGSWGIWM
jgi:hypothetical protein